MSYEAIGVISCVTPPDVMAMDLKNIYGRVRIIGRTLTTDERRKESQRMWTNDRLDGILRRKGDELIDLSEMYKVGLKGYTIMLIFTTQFLTGYGCFRKYVCKNGDNGNENTEKIFFYCHRFGLGRELFTYIIDHYNPLVRIIDLVPHTTYDVC